MFEDILRQMRESLRRRDQIVTNHAQEKMAERGISFYDVERAVFTGRIRIRQRDLLTHEAKYIIIGRAYRVDYIEVAAKLSKSGRLVVITAYVI